MLIYWKKKITDKLAYRLIYSDSRTALGYPYSSTSISISKKKYSILVIEILYSILISPAPVLSLSHTLYQLLHILFPSLPLSLSPQLSLSLLQWCYSVLAGCSRARSVAVCCAAGTLPGCLQSRGAHHAHATGSVPAALALPGADSLIGCNCSLFVFHV